jgi:hypothetical protein
VQAGEKLSARTYFACHNWHPTLEYILFFSDFCMS